MRYTQSLPPWDYGISKSGLGVNGSCGLRHAAQCVAPHEDEPAVHLRAERVGEARREQHVRFDRSAHLRDPGDLVDRRADLL